MIKAYFSCSQELFFQLSWIVFIRLINLWLTMPLVVTPLTNEVHGIPVTSTRLAVQAECIKPFDRPLLTFIPLPGRPVRRLQAKRSAAAPAKSPYALAPARGVFFPEFAAAFQARLRAERASRRAGAGNRATYRDDFAAFGSVAGEQENVLGGGDDWHAAGGGDDDDFPDGGDDYEPVDAIEVRRARNAEV